MRLIFAPIILAAAVAATAVAATPPTPAPARAPSDAALAARLAHAAEIAEQDRRSEALNVEVNRKNREVQARNDAKTAAFRKAMHDYQAAVAQQAAEQAAQAAADATVQATYEKAMSDWKAAVAACKAGDVSRCQAPAPRRARRQRGVDEPPSVVLKLRRRLI